MEHARLVRQTICDTSALEKEKASLQQKLAVLVEMTQNCIAENARIAQDQGGVAEMLQQAGGAIRESQGTVR